MIDRARRLHLAGEFRQARELARNVLKQRPHDLDALEVLALVEMEHGDLAGAIRMLRKIAKGRPGNAESQYNLGLAYRYAGRLELAVDGFRLALKFKPGFPRAMAELADTLANLGRFDEMEGVCRKLIEAAPSNPRAYAKLAFNRPAALGEADVAMMERCGHDPALSAGTRANFLFSLAEMLRRRGDHDAAFAALKQANDLVASTAGQERAASTAIAPQAEKPVVRTVAAAAASHRMLCDYVMQTFSPEFMTSFGGHGDKSRVPVFVVGMPRSGSTLVEQILASHPGVFGAGEIPDFDILTQRQWPYGGPPTADGKRPVAPPEPKERYFAGLGGRYVARLRELDGTAERVVNKMLGNYVHVGLIDLCLPNAVIVDIRRDAVDNCLACYQQQFRTGQEFTYDLAALGAQYRRYVEVMRHWDEVLPGRVLRVHYEALVSEPEAEMRRLLDHCGLPWSDEVMRFHDNARPVRTASLSQVRRPISTASVAKWEPYAAHLGPLFEALGDLAPEAAGDGISVPG